jgi:hypothetical protein
MEVSGQLVFRRLYPQGKKEPRAGLIQLEAWLAGPRAGVDALKKGTTRVNNEVIKCVDAIGLV